MEQLTNAMAALILLILVLFSAHQPLPAAAMQTSAAADEESVTPASPLPESVVSEVAQSLRRAVLLDGGSGTFFTASILLPYLRPLLTRRRITLLVPSDAAIAGAAFTSVTSSPLELLAAMSPSQLRSLARFHILTSNLSFASLLLLPEGALLPTLLGDAYRLRIASSVAGHVTIGAARVIRPDICPLSISNLVTCHGIDRILSLNTGGVDDVSPDPSSGNATGGGTSVSALPPPPPPQRSRPNAPSPPPPASAFIAYPVSDSSSNKYAPYPTASNSSNKTSGGAPMPSSNLSLPAAAASNDGHPVALSPAAAPQVVHSAAPPPTASSILWLDGRRRLVVVFFMLLQMQLR